MNERLDHLATDRLVLRRWRASDLDPFAALNADPRVLEHLPRALTRAECADWIARIEAHFDAHGFGLWAVEVTDPDDPVACAGFVGLQVPRFEAHFTPCVEIGWRLATATWGRGYATEAARAVRDAAFERLGLFEIVSLTVPANLRSRAVMERIGMVRDPADDFDHPSLPPGDRLERHVLYRMGPDAPRP